MLCMKQPGEPPKSPCLGKIVQLGQVHPSNYFLSGLPILWLGTTYSPWESPDLDLKE